MSFYLVVYLSVCLHPLGLTKIFYAFFYISVIYMAGDSRFKFQTNRIF